MRTTKFLFLALALLLALAVPVQAEAQGRDKIITASGAGDARLGVTADELAAALGDDYEVGDEVRITIDLQGHVVTSDGSVQFRAAKNPGSNQLSLFIISNADYATPEGVGPSTTIADAEAAYGQATLRWDPSDQGREFVSFANGPSAQILFRTPGIGGNNVGIYDDDSFETTEYEDGARIAAVWVGCVTGSDCPADDGGGLAEPEPTATATAEPEPTAAAEPEPTATAVPEPTATPEPEPTATPVPEPTATPDPEPTPGTVAGGSDTPDGELPRTGPQELALVSIVAALFVLGGAMVLSDRRLGLHPAWLASSRRR